MKWRRFSHFQSSYQSSKDKWTRFSMFISIPQIFKLASYHHSPNVASSYIKVDEIIFGSEENEMRWRECGSESEWREHKCDETPFFAMKSHKLLFVLGPYQFALPFYTRAECEEKMEKDMSFDLITSSQIHNDADWSSHTFSKNILREVSKSSILTIFFDQLRNILSCPFEFKTSSFKNFPTSNLFFNFLHFLRLGLRCYA